MRTYSPKSLHICAITEDTVSVHNLLNDRDIKCSRCVFGDLHCIRNEIRGLPLKMYIKCRNFSQNKSYLTKTIYAKCILIRGFIKK